MLKVLKKKRIETKVEAINHLGEDQFGFRRGRGTRDAIGVMSVVGERAIERVKLCIAQYVLCIARAHGRLRKGILPIGME